MSNTIKFNPSVLSASTISFIQSYNQGLVKSDSIDARNNTAFASIGIHEIPGQLMQVLITSTFDNDQSKQTFKISCQRFFRNCFKGKALLIKGNSVQPYTLLADETTDNKGKVIKLISAEVIEERKIAAKKEKAEKATKALEAEQAILKLEVANEAKAQAENSAAIAVKQANTAKKAAVALVAKAETSAENLAKQVAELTLELERVRHEASATVIEYQALKDSIFSAKSLKSLRDSLVPGYIAVSQPARNLNQVVNA